MLKVVHVDDSSAILCSVSRVLRAIPGVELVGTAGDVDGAVALIDAALPDVVLLDVNLSGGRKGLEVLQHVRRGHPQTQVIVLTSAASPVLRLAYLNAGAQGYFDKAHESLQASAWIAERAALAGSIRAADGVRQV